MRHRGKKLVRYGKGWIDPEDHSGYNFQPGIIYYLKRRGRRKFLIAKRYRPKFRKVTTSDKFFEWIVWLLNLLLWVGIIALIFWLVEEIFFK